MANITTALISAFVAIFVLIANQWFGARRARTQLLEGKLEELYRAILSVWDETATPTSDLKEQQFHKAHRNLRIAEMLCGIYFRKCMPRFLALAKAASAAASMLSNNKQPTEIHVDAVRSCCAEFISFLTDNQKELTEELWRWPD